MFAITLAAIVVCGLTCAWALARAAAIGDRVERQAYAREIAKREVERRYWNHRYIGNHWPGQTFETTTTEDARKSLMRRFDRGGGE